MPQALPGAQPHDPPGGARRAADGRGAVALAGAQPGAAEAQEGAVPAGGRVRRLHREGTLQSERREALRNHAMPPTPALRELTIEKVPKRLLHVPQHGGQYALCYKGHCLEQRCKTRPN